MLKLFDFIAGVECLDTHDVFAEHYRGRRNITESGKLCAPPCRGQLGIGPVCPVLRCTLGKNTMEPCMIHYCSKNTIISFTVLKRG